MLNFNSRAVTLAFLVLGFVIIPGWGQTNGGAEHSPPSSITPGNSRATLDKLEVIEGRSTIDVAITSSRPVTPAFSTLQEPHRLPVDFPDTFPNLQSHRVEVNRGGVRSIRLAVHGQDPPITRVVVDLDQAPKYQVQRNGDRIVLKFSNPVRTTVATTKSNPTAPPAVPPQPIAFAVLQQGPTHSLPMHGARSAQAESVGIAQSAGSAPLFVLSQVSPSVSLAQPETQHQPATGPDENKSVPAPPTAVTEAPLSKRVPSDFEQPPASKPALSETAANAAAPPPAAPTSNEASESMLATPEPKASRVNQPPPQPSQQNNLDSRHADADNQFVIGSDDVLSINVWKEPEMSRVVPVRTDGKISLPLLGDVVASGRTPAQLQDELTKRLKDFMLEPEVTVIVQEIKSQKFNIVGMVVRPGSYLVTNPMTVLDAIALAGGFRDFAKQKSIYILRFKPDGTKERLAFNYKQVIKGKNEDQNIQLEPRDTIVIP